MRRRCSARIPASPRQRPRMRIRASSSGFTSANRSKKGPHTVEKSASVPPISTSGLCTELRARWGEKWGTFLNWWNVVDGREKDLKEQKMHHYHLAQEGKSAIGQLIAALPSQSPLQTLSFGIPARQIREPSG